MAIYIKKKKSAIKEEAPQAPQQTSQQNAADLNKAQNLRNQILQLKAQITAAEKEFNDKKNNLEQQIAQVNTRLVELNQDPDVSESESVETDLKSLLESFKGNRTEDMYGLIQVCNDRLRNKLSYTMQNSEAKYLARILVEFINKRVINKRGITPTFEEDFKKFLFEYFTTGRISLSKRETTDFINALIDILKNSDAFEDLFS